MGHEVPGASALLGGGILMVYQKENTFQVGEVLVLSVAWGTHELDFFLNPLHCFVLFPQTDRTVL